MVFHERTANLERAPQARPAWRRSWEAQKPAEYLADRRFQQCAATRSVCLAVLGRGAKLVTCGRVVAR